MFILFNKFFERVINILSALRVSLKLNLFKSSMSEYLSIRYAIYHLESKILFRFKNINSYIFKNKNAREFHGKGYSTFTNTNIEKECKKILKKLELHKKPWDSNNIFIESATDNYRGELINIFKNGVDEFIKSTFQSDYYIFYHILYKSERLSKEIVPQGSELWHADGGPGICMNLMICHSPIDELNGSMKIIPWRKSKKLLSQLTFQFNQLLSNNLYLREKSNNDRLYSRSIKCEILRERIKRNLIKFYQPISKRSGTIFAFRNNCVHSGGFAEIGSKRIVCVLHIYPSKIQSTLEEKFEGNHQKKQPLPKINALPSNYK